MTTTLLEQLLDEPTLPETVATLNERLESERERRARFRDELRADQKAEFINGQIVRHSPALNRHLVVTGRLFSLMQVFVAKRRLGHVVTEKALCGFPRNDYEPDVAFFGATKAVTIQPDTDVFPIPDFICEVLSDSTESRDRGIKFRDYAAHGVAEYWIIDARTEVLEQYIACADDYDLRLKSGTGDVDSVAVPGFRIPIRALFDGEENLRALQRLLG
jgi:Uma2 family endonuclease